LFLKLLPQVSSHLNDFVIVCLISCDMVSKGCILITIRDNSSWLCSQ